MDITYILIANGFMYKTTLSNTLDANASLEVIKEAIATHGKPEILNSYQGAQFTCAEYVEYLKNMQIKISMDGKGRALYNVYIERFWSTLKYQHAYLSPADHGTQRYQGIENWINRYHNRDHQGIGRIRPNVLYRKAA